MATVSTIIRKDKINKQGNVPIYFRIIKNRKPSYISSGISIPIQKWDERNKKVKAGIKNSARFNSYLANKFTEIQDTVFEYETVSKSLTSKKLKEKAFGKKPVEFFPFAETVIQQYKEAGRINSYRRSKATLGKFKRFFNNEQLSFSDITLEFLLRYEKYCRDELNNKTNTIHKDMKLLRKVFNDAIRLEVIESVVSPFRKYQMRLEKTSKDYLTEEELELIANCPTSSGSKIELHRDMFLFAAYTGGIRISDLLRLRWKDFDGTHLHIFIKKTQVPLVIKVPIRCTEIMNKYLPKMKNKNSFIFPMLPQAIDLTNPEVENLAISRATAYTNKNLKIIADAAGIEKNLSFHISRHTFAVMALRRGISIDKVSKLMAHASLRETQVYAKIVNEELDRAMDVFN